MGPDWYGEDWRAWRTLVKALFGEPLTEDETELYYQCTGSEPTGRLNREAWLIVGRRGGKSRVLSMIAIYLAVCCDWSKYRVAGERGYITVLAAQTRQATVIMGYVKATLIRHPKLSSMIVKPLAESIELDDSIVIEIIPASISAGRSRTIIAALADEIAFWNSDDAAANPDEEILNALRPAMLTIPSSMLLAASSRYARRGALWNAYRDWYGKTEGPLVWSADTVTMHPSVDRDFIAAEYERDPIAAASEYGLEFRSDVAAFVSREVLDASVAHGIYERAPSPGISYFAFVDPSGGSADSFTLAIAHREGVNAVLDLVREERPPFSPASVVQEFRATLKDYKVKSVRGDHYAGEWPREQFRMLGINYELSEETKSDIYQEWLPLLNSGRITLLDNARLIAQASVLERRTSRVGKDSIDHPPGGHDDVVNAVAGAQVMALDGINAKPFVLSEKALAQITSVQTRNHFASPARDRFVRAR